MSWDYIAIIVLLAVVVPWRSAHHVRALLAAPHISSAQRLALYGSTIAFQGLVAGFTLWRSFAHGLGAQQLGLTSGIVFRTAVGTAALCVLLASNQWFSLKELSPPACLDSPSVQLRWKLMPHTQTEKLLFIGVVLTASLCEEFIYRGFVQFIFSRPGAFGAIAGILISSLMFAAAHTYQGKRGAIASFVAGMLFAGARAWTGSLLPGVAAHFLTNVMAGLMGPMANGTECAT
jgi:membrane protease YdiL (CAAX protease family)